ncbi:hypothetical protein DFH11DRAFT_1628246 [Phellopilus nigrolimitatus]|nr:hypothetical protein DFH11DRAFT_1628246 [Phellopilus nigrolimitatus]
MQMSLRTCAVLAFTSTVLLLAWLWSSAKTGARAYCMYQYNKLDECHSRKCLLVAYMGDDYPMTWPLPEVSPVLMYPEDTNRYALDTPDGEAEWRALVPPSSGNGTVHLGPHARPFTVAMFHQLQCLDVVRSSIASRGEIDQRAKELTDHCMNYLRQAVLCHARTVLESVRSDIGPKITDLARSEYVCRDWRVLYEAFQ